MAQISVGIDIGDELLTAAAVTGTGRDAEVLACAAVVRQMPGTADLSAELSLLLEQIGLKTHRCIAGLALSNLNLRNLSFPFADEKKIRQILPFELEEQLLRPLDEQIIATASAGGKEGGATLLAAVVEKNLLRSNLAALQGVGLEPDKICPAVYVLTDRLCRIEHTGSTFFLLHGDLSAVQMVLVRLGEIVFMRRLSWPDTVFTDAVLRREAGGLIIADQTAAEKVIISLCGLVQRSLDYCALQSGEEIRPDYFVLSGPIQDCPGFKKKLEVGFGIPSRFCDLVRDGAAVVTGQAAERWRAALYDSALALALHQTGRRSKEAGLNFRQGEFAPPRHLFGSKKQLTAAALTAGMLLLFGGGWLFYEQRQLEQQQSQLTAKMEKVFQESFPGIKAGPDPLMHMRSRRKSMDSSAVSMPLFTEEKRVLVILADISARIPASVQVKVDRLVVDQTSVSIKGSTDAFNNVNMMESLLKKSGRYAEVKIVSAAKGRQDEGILFEIRLQLQTEASS